MNCGHVQSNLSLYLYGELEFAMEDAVEDHLANCAFCQLALGREKALHATLNAQASSVPFDILTDCRRSLQKAIGSEHARARSLENKRPAWHDWAQVFESVWPTRVAAALLLLTVGFGAGRWQGVRTTSGPGLPEPYTRVTGIQPAESGRVHLVVDRIQQGELTGTLSDDRVRKLVLIATKDPNDPAIRVDSVELLNGQTGDDVRDALIASVRHDSNAAVRLKALEGLRSFAADPVTHRVLVDILKNDDNPGVRSEAIDVLLPATRRVVVTPDLLQMLDQVVRSQSGDEYVRLRCLQVLKSASTQAEVY